MEGDVDLSCHNFQSADELVILPPLLLSFPLLPVLLPLASPLLSSPLLSSSSSPLQRVSRRNGKVYALGGMGADTTPQALVRVYEAEKDQWLTMTSMPTPRYGATPFVTGNKIYMLGGRQGKMPVTALEAFDLEMKSWTRYPCIPSRRAFSCCTTNERSLFSLGGLQQPGPHNFYSRPHFVSTMEEYDLDQASDLLLPTSVDHHISTDPGN
ncbi:unnamed protein product [Pleuronectes platessa]|uniref:Kelch domain-containing protein 8B n=1 Tax=Pleuronectes platessa TaxID=8262 RepID=A0A9N7YLF9_PLEPL|nr:unnamed protein product [Pleuronectes platessa]